MKKFITFCFLFNICALAKTQITVGFESYELPPETHLSEAPNMVFFEEEGLQLYNTYDATYDYWTGWAITNETNTSTPGFNNQYSAIAGKGTDGSANYATAYVAGESIMDLSPDADVHHIDGFYITNSTYAYLSMLNGDAFAKKFGGVTGTDPDFFLLTITGYKQGQITDTMEVYLADYRDEDSSKDYILKDWKYIDVSKIGEIDYLSFSLTSSDVGQFGMNTPAYFCVDNISLATTSSLETILENTSAVYPNPTSILLNIEAQQAISSITLVDGLGKLVMTREIDKKQETLNIATLSPGNYTMFIRNSHGVEIHRVLKL
jgi:hypothetical protein